MPKNKKRKSRTSAPQKGARAMLPICARAVIVSYAFFFICTAIFAWFVFQKESAPTKPVQTVFLFIITTISFLLCGCITARKNTYPVLPICFFSGFALLILFVVTLLLAAKGNVSVLICAPIGIGLICPIVSGIIGKRL